MSIHIGRGAGTGIALPPDMILTIPEIATLAHRTTRQVRRWIDLAILTDGKEGLKSSISGWRRVVSAEDWQAFTPSKHPGPPADVGSKGGHARARKIRMAKCQPKRP